MGGSSVKNTLGRVGAGIATGGLSEFAQKNPFLEGAVKNPLAPNTPFFQQDGLFGGNSATSPYISGPFSLDPYQLTQDKADINTEGQKQYQQMQDYINQDTGTRSTARQALADALTKQSQTSFNQGLSSTLEDLNARHLANGSGVGQEIARQQANIASDIANQVGTQGVADINRTSDLQGQALQGLQGFQTGALQRGQSLEDFINQANVAKTIGAQMAPQAPNSKQNFGTVAQGAGALAPLAKLGKAAAPAAVAAV